MEKIPRWLFHILEIYDLYILHQNLHPKIKLTMEHSFKELPFLDVLIKPQNGQIIRHLLQTHRHPKIPNFKSHHPHKTV